MVEGSILSVIHAVTIGTMLNFNIWLNFGLKYQAKLLYV